MAEVRRTTCNRDCPDSCGILATVEDGRVTRITGDPDHPVTRGFLCFRTNRFLSTQYSPDRLTSPLLRKNGRLEPVEWEEALDFAAESLLRIRKESGPAAIFHYRSGGTLGLLSALTDLFFEKFGPCTVKRGDICSGAGEAAQELDFGICESHDLFDLHNSKNIILWGKNVFTSSPHTIPVLKEARGRGARLVLVDPVHHRTASLCDRFWQPRPGGDFALAMAVANRLFENGGVDPQAARYCDHWGALEALATSRSVEDWCRDADVPPSAADDLAERLAERPCAILVGWGMGRRTNGGAIVRALDALSAISGNLGIEGGGASFYFRRRAAFDRPFLGENPPPRTLSEPLFGNEILAADDPPVRGVWVTAGNPVVMLPDSETNARALETREFVAVVDSFLTDTAKRAHLVLPTTTLLESDDLVGAYGHHYISASQPVVPPPEGVKTDLDIMQALAERVGLGEALAGHARSWKRRFLPRLEAAGVSLEALESGAVKNPFAEPVLFRDYQFPTPTGKVNLVHDAPPAAGTPGDDELWLLSISTPKSQSSQWATDPPAAPVVATLHPDACQGVPDGSEAILRSKKGSLRVRVRHDAKQRRDVVLVPKGGHFDSGACANRLLDATLTDLGEGGALYEATVALSPA